MVDLTNVTGSAKIRWLKTLFNFLYRRRGSGTMANKEGKSKNALRKELQRYKLSGQERGIVQRFVRANSDGVVLEDRDPTVVVKVGFREPVGFGFLVPQLFATGVAVRGPGDEYVRCEGVRIATKRSVRIIAKQLCAVMEGMSPVDGVITIEKMKRNLLMTTNTRELGIED